MTDGTPRHQPLQSSDDMGESTLAEAKILQPDDLHNLFEVTNPTTEDDDPLAAMRHDPNYSALIRDLEYIAAQARLLFQPAEATPSDTVWDKIQSKLAQSSDSIESEEETTDEDDLGGEPALTVG